MQIHWLVTDQLGTPRMDFDQTGALPNVSRHDYLPFGEELYAGTGGRTTAQGYVGDSTRQQFTGYEGDAETGLNFAQARYQSPMQGRFTSVDPLGASASVLNPQTFNRYSYVLNNPTNLIDPLGLMKSVPMSAGGKGHSDDDDDQSEDPFETGLDIIIAREASIDRAAIAAMHSPWPPGTHDDILRTALSGIRGVTEADIAEAQAGSREVDWGEGYDTWDPAQAYLHSMVPEPWVRKYENEGLSHDAALAKATEDAK